MKKQKKYFFLGLLFLICALFCVTFLPPFMRIFKGVFLREYFFVQAEFFLLVVASVFFLFSPKFYKGQILSVLLGIIFYILFVKVYPFIF